MDSLTEEQYKLYKGIKTAEKTKQTLETKKKLVPIYTQAQKLYMNMRICVHNVKNSQLQVACTWRPGVDL